MFSSLTLIILGLLMLTSCENVKKDSRQARIFTFNPENEDVEVGLDFSIPFLKIPIKKTFNAVAQFGLPGFSVPKMNFNPIALAVGGMLIVTTKLFAPFLNKFAWHNFDRSSRAVLDNESYDPTEYFTERLVANSQGCPERISCWTSQKLKNSEMAKAWKKLMSNKLLSTMVNTTALEIAARNGRKGLNCEVYSPCPIDERTLPEIINNFVILFNSRTQ